MCIVIYPSPSTAVWTATFIAQTRMNYEMHYTQSVLQCSRVRREGNLGVVSSEHKDKEIT
jgi:hypothetical protein